MNKNILLVLLILLLGNACKKKGIGEQTPAPEEITLDNITVNRGFTFNTSKDISINIRAMDNADNPVPGIRVNIYSDFPEKKGSLLFSCFTDDGGLHKSDLRIPAYMDSLVVQTDAIGFIGLQKIRITSNKLSCILGGKTPVMNGRAWESIGSSFSPSSYGARTDGAPLLQSLGSFNSLGVPSYLVNPNDIIHASVISDLNAALPEHQSVPVNRPSYMTASNRSDLEFNQVTNVVLTFLHEGASFKNVLGFYKYNSNNPPATPDDIDTIFAAFPNVKYINNGGGLVSGNKVMLPLGTFQPGTALGFVLITDGFRNSNITTGNEMFYSNPAFNPETDVNKKKHSLLLRDIVRNNFVLSFEDKRRDGVCDDDFNDAIFFINVNPVQAVNMANVPAVNYNATDTDNDGVSDNLDDYPTDPLKAFNNYYPSQNNVGTLAFEDLWPSKGDYDFNDMVVDYNFNRVTNSMNQVVQIKATLTLKAIGASYHNGFGIQLPISSSLVAGVSGTDVRTSLIVKNSNGTESGQSKATIIVFDDAFDHLPWPGGNAIGVNTTIGAPYVQPKTFNLVINLATPVNQDALGLPPFNPFIFTNKTRSREVHLINKPPTDLANASLLGTAQDNSNSATGRYYVTATNLPFAIDIAGPFDYATEKSKITQSHLQFSNWAISGGIQFSDWFLPITSYRNEAKIYKR